MKNIPIRISRSLAGTGHYPRHFAESIIRAQQDERARIGHELHDNVNQILSSVHLYLSVLKKDSADFDEVRKKTMDILLFGIEEIRHLSREMVMNDLKQDGLIGSIRNIVKDIYNTGLLNIQFVHSDICVVEALDCCKKIALLRTVQEQVKNILKYSHSKNVEISLYCMDDQVRLQIRDDGVGFDAAGIKKGLGLSHIFERFTLYNGKVLLDTAPGRGCSLIVNIPLSPVRLC